MFKGPYEGGVGVLGQVPVLAAPSADASSSPSSGRGSAASFFLKRFELPSAEATTGGRSGVRVKRAPASPVQSSHCHCRGTPHTPAPRARRATQVQGPM